MFRQHARGSRMGALCSHCRAAAHVVCTNLFVIIHHVLARTVTGVFCTRLCCPLDAIKEPPLHAVTHTQTENKPASVSLYEITPPAEQWTPASALRLEPATAEDPARAKTAPVPAARRAAVIAALQAAASAPLAACAKGRHVTPAAASEESTASPLSCT